jgi:hypothetical protein
MIPPGGRHFATVIGGLRRILIAAAAAAQAPTVVQGVALNAASYAPAGLPQYGVDPGIRCAVVGTGFVTGVWSSGT